MAQEFQIYVQIWNRTIGRGWKNWTNRQTNRQIYVNFCIDNTKFYFLGNKITKEPIQIASFTLAWPTIVTSAMWFRPLTKCLTGVLIWRQEKRRELKIFSFDVIIIFRLNVSTILEYDWALLWYVINKMTTKTSL